MTAHLCVRHVAAIGLMVNEIQARNPIKKLSRRTADDRAHEISWLSNRTLAFAAPHIFREGLSPQANRISTELAGCSAGIQNIYEFTTFDKPE